MGAPPPRVQGDDAVYNGTPDSQAVEGPVATALPVTPPGATSQKPLPAATPPAATPPAVAPAPAAAAAQQTGALPDSYTDPVTNVTTDLRAYNNIDKRKFLSEQGLKEQERASANLVARGKEAEPIRRAILEFRPGVTDQIFSDLASLETIAKRSPKVFDILRNNNDIRDLVNTAISKGIPLGNFGSLSLPVADYIVADMSPAMRTDYQRARMILAQQFFASAMANKAAIPGTISNNEDKLLQAPLANMDDTVQAVMDYIKRTQVQNGHRAQMYKAFTEYEQGNKGAGLETFFDPDNKKSRYHQVNTHYADMYRTVTGEQ